MALFQFWSRTEYNNKKRLITRSLFGGSTNNNTMAKKEKEIKMNKFTYEIVVNVGSYQSIRIGGEWSVTDTPTTEQVISIDAGLRQKVAEVIESRKAVPAQPQPENKENKENKPEQAEAKTEEKPVDNTLELVPSNSPKFQAILKKIQNGTPEETVRKYFRFDEKGEQIIAIAYSDLIKEGGKPIEELKDKLPSKDKPKDTQK